MTRLVSWCTLTAWAMAAGDLTSSLTPDVAEPSPLQEGGETGNWHLTLPPSPPTHLFLPLSLTPAPPTPTCPSPLSFLSVLPLPFRPSASPFLALPRQGSWHLTLDTPSFSSYTPSLLPLQSLPFAPLSFLLILFPSCPSHSLLCLPLLLPHFLLPASPPLSILPLPSWPSSPVPPTPFPLPLVPQLHEVVAGSEGHQVGVEGGGRNGHRPRAPDIGVTEPQHVVVRRLRRPLVG